MYGLDFLFGRIVFRALFMSGMASSYGESLKRTFVPEFLSMNVLMSGMNPVAALFAHYFDASRDPAQPEFWFRMSMALLAGFVVAFPMNWWLVSHHLKHGMTTVRPALQAPAIADSKRLPGATHSEHSGVTKSTSAAKTLPWIAIVGMMILSLIALTAGLAIALWITALR